MFSDDFISIFNDFRKNRWETLLDCFFSIFSHCALLTSFFFYMHIKLKAENHKFIGKCIIQPALSAFFQGLCIVLY